MSVIISHPTGNANLRAVLRALQDRGILHEFCTTLSIPTSLIAKAPISKEMKSKLSSRMFPEVPTTAICTRSLREAVRQFAKVSGLNGLTRHEIGWASYHQVYYDLDRAVSRNMPRFVSEGARIVYAYEDGAQKSFQQAKRLGLKCVYDLPSPHWRAVKEILEFERDRRPSWVRTMPGLKDSEQSRNRKDEELYLSRKSSGSF